MDDQRAGMSEGRVVGTPFNRLCVRFCCCAAPGRPRRTEIAVARSGPSRSACRALRVPLRPARVRVLRGSYRIPVSSFTGESPAKIPGATGARGPGWPPRRYVDLGVTCWLSPPSGERPRFFLALDQVQDPRTLVIASAAPDRRRFWRPRRDRSQAPLGRASPTPRPRTGHGERLAYVSGGRGNTKHGSQRWKSFKDIRGVGSNGFGAVLGAGARGPWTLRWSPCV
jgi:hypothetical protein